MASGRQWESFMDQDDDGPGLVAWILAADLATLFVACYAIWHWVAGGVGWWP